jgi:hypothetical protein
MSPTRRSRRNKSSFVPIQYEEIVTTLENFASTIFSKDGKKALIDPCNSTISACMNDHRLYFENIFDPICEKIFCRVETMLSEKTRATKSRTKIFNSNVDLKMIGTSMRENISRMQTNNSSSFARGAT